MKKIDAVSYTADPCLHTFYKRTPKYLFIILFLILIIFGCTFYQRAVGQVKVKKDVEYTYQLARLPDENTFKVEVDTTTRNIMTIIYKSREAGINEISALKIAICESRLDDQAKNSDSSAKGLFQIVDRTFKNYCTGDPLNAEDNINCFTKLYKLHPSWWVCKE